MLFNELCASRKDSPRCAEAEVALLHGRLRPHSCTPTAGVLDPLTRLTVVVPVGPGDQLAPLLHVQLCALPRQASVCVVTCDGAQSLASGCDIERAIKEGGPQWHWLRAPIGRSAQQNAGTAAGGGDWLWFLHADTQLTDATLPALARFIAADCAALGYFDLRFLEGGPALMRLNAIGAWLRSRWLRMPFGDQGLCLPRSVFDALGGFDTTTLRGEDHQLVWRARAAGVPVRAVGATVYTSARRYAVAGWFATTRMHVAQTWRQARQFSREARTR